MGPPCALFLAFVARCECDNVSRTDMAMLSHGRAMILYCTAMVLYCRLRLRGASSTADCANLVTGIEYKNVVSFLIHPVVSPLFSRMLFRAVKERSEGCRVMPRHNISLIVTKQHKLRSLSRTTTGEKHGRRNNRETTMFTEAWHWVNKAWHGVNRQKILVIIPSYVTKSSY